MSFKDQGTYITGVWYVSPVCQITEPVDMLVKIQGLRINNSKVSSKKMDKKCVIKIGYFK